MMDMQHILFCVVYIFGIVNIDAQSFFSRPVKRFLLVPSFRSDAILQLLFFTQLRNSLVVHLLGVRHNCCMERTCRSLWSCLLAQCNLYVLFCPSVRTYIHMSDMTVRSLGAERQLLRGALVSLEIFITIGVLVIVS